MHDTMYLTIHGHFYQPPREDPWTGAVPLQDGASPHHDWNERIASECYAPNARSRVLDPAGRIEAIVNNYESIHFDFGPTLLHWIATTRPRLYRDILDADARSVRRRGGHGNAIAQAYNHMILPLSNPRDKRTQVLWGLRDFEHRFGRRSESIWLPETAVDPETLRVLARFGIRYLILAPTQACRTRSLAGGEWTDVSGGRIDPRRPYRVFLPAEEGSAAGSIDVFFYDGPLSHAISFGHLLRSAAALADRVKQAAKGGGTNGLVHVATDGEIYGHHEPFGDMCLAYLISREAQRRGIRITNYGQHLDQHPPQEEVELDYGEAGRGSSWSCAHGTGRWEVDCGCSISGRPDWNQRWRRFLRVGLDQLRDRLVEIYVGRLGEIVEDPWEARDDYIGVLLDPTTRGSFLERHARGSLPAGDRRVFWRLIESQHQAMLMFTSCAWFFDDISGIEVQQNLAYAARAIELVEPFSDVDLEEELLGIIGEARSNLPGIGTGADVWRRFVRPTRMDPAVVALDAIGRIAASPGAAFNGTNAFGVTLRSLEGRLEDGRVRARIEVTDRATGETFPIEAEAAKDPHRLMVLTARPDGEGGAAPAVERTVSDLPLETQMVITQTVLADLLEREQGRLDEIFEESRPMLECCRATDRILPPIFRLLAEDVLGRRCERAARELRRVDPRERTGAEIRRATAELFSLAERIGVDLGRGSVAGVIEEALRCNLGNVQLVSADDVGRSIDLLRAAEAIGVRILRTELEENVYALLSCHRAALVARSKGGSIPKGGIDPEILIRLAEISNLSPTAMERAPSRSR